MPANLSSSSNFQLRPEQTNYAAIDLKSLGKIEHAISDDENEGLRIGNDKRTPSQFQDGIKRTGLVFSAMGVSPSQPREKNDDVDEDFDAWLADPSPEGLTYDGRKDGKQ